MQNSPEIEETRSISAIWLLPFIALCIGSWIAYTSYRDAGVEITISFDDASGIVPSKTQVIVKGIPVGKVKKITPDIKEKKVRVTVEMDRVMVDYLVEDTLFWVVRPELSASSIRGLDTILSGSYIGVQAGNSKVAARTFTGLTSPPPVSPGAPGLHIQLQAEKLGSIQTGTGIYYRNIEIGTVQDFRLEKNKSILIDLYIRQEYAELVRDGSRFCNASGVQITGKLPNLKIQVESLASLLRGGILLHTPAQLQDTPPAKNGHVFPLYPDYESANYGIPMTLTLSSGEDIVEGATKVMYRGLEAGFVKEIKIEPDKLHTVTAHILLDPRAELILRENTSFWLVKPEISPSGISNLRLMLSGAYITFRPGDGGFKDHFAILPEPPSLRPLRPGKIFVLNSKGPSQVSSHSPVYYKNIQVGEVTSVDIDSSGNKLKTSIFIYRKYLPLVTTRSVFWVRSGVSVEAALDSGLSISTGPLASMIRGGIEFMSPDRSQKKKVLVPQENHTFQLYENLQEAKKNESLLIRKGIRFQLTADSSQSLSIGSPILHKKIPIGEVVDFRLSPEKDKVLIECFVKEEFKDIIRETTRFFNNSGVQLSGGINGISLRTGSLQSIIAGGIGCVNLDGQQGKPKPSTTPYQLYADLQDALHADEVTLTVRFHNIGDLREGSPVRYKGIRVGRIAHFSFAPGMKEIIGKVQVSSEVAQLFRQHTRIWIENAEINLSGVKNIETIVFGSYLNFLPGSGPPRRDFIAIDEPPRTEIANQDGFGIILESSHLGSLSINSPIYYRQVQVGKVTGWELAKTFQKVLIHASINMRYRPVIRENTRFWNVSGTKVEGGIFSGLTIATESFEAFMRGGIALATPNNEISGSPVAAGHHFTLYEKAEPEWTDWSPNIILLKERDGADAVYEKFDEK